MYLPANATHDKFAVYQGCMCVELIKVLRIQRFQLLIKMRWSEPRADNQKVWGPIPIPNAGHSLER